MLYQLGWLACNQMLTSGSPCICGVWGCRALVAAPVALGRSPSRMSEPSSRRARRGLWEVRNGLVWTLWVPAARLDESELNLIGMGRCQAMIV